MAKRNDSHDSARFTRFTRLTASAAFVLSRRCGEDKLRAFMRPAAVLFAGLAGLLTASGQSGSSKLERTMLAGTEYVRLADWSKPLNFQTHWTRQNEEVQLTSASSRLVFTLDAERAEINGVNAWLSAPVTARNGTVYLGLVDVQTVLQPVLCPPKNPGGAPILSICLDPGHGGRDPGNEEGRRREKDYTFLLARDL